MKALLQTGSSGRVPVPREKRFLINRWEDLSEFLRNSNRVAALHAQIKRTLWEALLTHQCDKEQVLHLLSETEHMRWVAFHVMAGWRQAVASMTDRKLRAMTRAHPNITPFDQLDRETKRYDLNNVLSALDLPLETTCRGITHD